METVTLLSILACDSIAVPLSSAFPASELRYILENSEAVTLLSSGKFKEKAEEVLKEGLEHLPRKPVLNVVEKRLSGSGDDEVQLVPLPMTKGGMMLYTSGTTSRPVGTLILQSENNADASTERRPPPWKNPHSSGRIPPQSLAIHPTRPPFARPSPPSHPRYRQRPPHTSLRRRNNRIYVPLQRRRGLGALSGTVHTRPKEAAHHIPYSGPYNLQSLPFLIRQALSTHTGSCQNGFVTGESTPQHIWICCTTDAYEEVMDRAERWQRVA